MKELLLLNLSGPDAVVNYIALGAMFMSGGYIAYFVYKRATDKNPDKKVTDTTAQVIHKEEIDHQQATKNPSQGSLPKEKESIQTVYPYATAGPDYQTSQQSGHPQPINTNNNAADSLVEPLPTPAASEVPEDSHEFSNIPVSTLTQLFSFSDKQVDALMQNNENQYEGEMSDEVNVDFIIKDEVMHTLVTSQVDTADEAQAWKGEDQPSEDERIDEKVSEDYEAHKEFFMPVHELFESMEKIQTLMNEVNSFVESYKKKALASHTESAQRELITATEDAYQYMILELKDKKLFHVFGAEVKELHKDLRETPFFELDPSDSLLFTSLMKA